MSRHLPLVRYRPPDGTYLAWLDCTALDLPCSPGELVSDRAHVTVVDGPAFGDGGAGSFRFNFATPQPILAEMVEHIAAALNSRLRPPAHSRRSWRPAVLRARRAAAGPSSAGSIAAGTATCRPRLRRRTWTGGPSR